MDDLLLKQSYPINPYYRAVMMVLERLLWDLHPESWSSRRKFRQCRDSHSGEKAVILCNGPSLLRADLSSLKKVYTFGLNKINLLYPETNFRPDCIVAVNPYVIRQNRDYYNETEIPLYLDSCALKSRIKNRKNITFLHLTRINRFARDCSMSVSLGGTVTFVAMQIAFHMGFNEVALIGCDHHFEDLGPPGAVVKSGEADRNHFSKDYFADGQQWQLPDLARSEEGYRLAKRVFEAHGRRIVNATDGGRLEIFKRMPLKNFLSGGAHNNNQ